MVNIVVFATIKQLSSVLWGKIILLFLKEINAYMQACLAVNFRIMTNRDKPRVLESI